MELDFFGDILENGTLINRKVRRNEKLVDLTKDKGVFEIKQNEGWFEKVNVRIISSYSDPTTILQYRLEDEDNWKNYPDEGLEINKNTKIFGRYYDETVDEIGYEFCDEISVIDDENPNILVSESSSTENSISISVNATDAKIGMPTQIEYNYYKSTDGIEYTLDESSNSNTHTYTNLNQNINYYFKVTAKDKANNEGEGIIQLKTVRLLTTDFSENDNSICTLTASGTFSDYYPYKGFSTLGTSTGNTRLWCNSGGNDGWLRIKFKNKKYKITKIQLITYHNVGNGHVIQAGNFWFQASKDNFATYDTLYTYTSGNSTSLQTFNINTNQYYDDYRFYVAGGGNWPGLQGIQIYGIEE